MSRHCNFRVCVSVCVSGILITEFTKLVNSSPAFFSSACFLPRSRHDGGPRTQTHIRRHLKSVCGLPPSWHLHMYTHTRTHMPVLVRMAGHRIIMDNNGVNVSCYCGPYHNILLICEYKMSDCAACMFLIACSHMRQRPPLLHHFISISISQNQSPQLKPNSHTTNLISSPPGLPWAPPRLPSFLLHPPMLKKEKDNRHAEITAWAPALWETLPSLSICSSLPLFVCFFLSACTTVRGSGRVYLMCISLQKHAFLCL